MASVKETKAQLLRGVVQDNVDVLHGVRDEPGNATRSRLELWLWLGLLIAATVFLTVPSHVVSKGSAPATIPSGLSRISHRQN